MGADIAEAEAPAPAARPPELDALAARFAKHRDRKTTAPQSVSAEVPESLRDADQALTRYGEWATTWEGRGGRPETVDRMYDRRGDRKESLESFLRRRAEVPRPLLMPMRDALNVQRALSQVPHHERFVLSVLYVPRRLPPEAQLRLKHIPPQLSRIRHLQGLRMFDNLHRMLLLRAGAR